MTQDWLAERFEANLPHLRQVAFRMLGSQAEADDAVQEAWLKLSRTDAGDIENFGGWLTTVVARVSPQAPVAARGACRQAAAHRRRRGPRGARRCSPTRWVKRCC